MRWLDGITNSMDIFHNCSSSWERGEGGFEHFKFKLASEPPIIPDRLYKAGDDSRSWNFHRTPPDVIHALKADKIMSQTNRTI